MKTPASSSFSPALAVAALPLAADEGMWMPQQIPTSPSSSRRMGFAGDPQAFADLTGQPMGADRLARRLQRVVRLARRPHRHQPPLRPGVAPVQLDPAEEPPRERLPREDPRGGALERPRLARLRHVSVKEVTDAITGKIDPKLDDRERFDVIERRVKERMAACEKGGLRCRSRLLRGLAVLRDRAARDPRRPPRLRPARRGSATSAARPTTGGGRATPATGRSTAPTSARTASRPPFSKDNVPYQPKHWLQVQPAGVKEGDLVFVVGYPGRTQRHQTYAEVKETTEWAFPRFVTAQQEQIAHPRGAREDATGAGDQGRRARARPQQLAHEPQGPARRLVKGGILAQKEAHEKALAAWIAADPAAAEGVRRRPARPRRAAGRVREDPRAGRRLRRPSSRRLLPARRGQLRPPPLPRAGEEERHGPRARVPGAELDEDPRGPGACPADRRRPARPGAPRAGRWPTRPPCPPSSASPGSTSSSASPRG